MSQTVFSSKGTAVPPKCIDCGTTLGNYSDWHHGEGPLCYICYRKRAKK